MNTTYIITLVSDQTVPNVLFLNWYFKNNMAEKNQKLVFVSTKVMEEKGKSSSIAGAVNTQLVAHAVSDYEVYKVDENDLQGTWNTISTVLAPCDETDRIIGNITGGTKMMSLGAYAAFSEIENCTVYYQPIGKTEIQQILPVEDNVEVHRSVTNMINLWEYFEACGIECKSSRKPIKTWDFNKNVFSLIEKTKFFRETLLWMQSGDGYSRDGNWLKRIIDDNKSVNLLNEPDYKFEMFNVSKEEFCEGIQLFEFDSKKLHASEIKYITGGWFEEYTYQKLLNSDLFSHCADKEDRIALNVTIEKENARNELDVVYIDEKNNLHIIECKSFIDDQRKLLTNTIYKSQAIKSNFGLTVSSELWTKSDITKPEIISRAKSFNIKLITGANC